MKDKALIEEISKLQEDYEYNQEVYFIYIYIYIYIERERERERERESALPLFAYTHIFNMW